TAIQGRVHFARDLQANHIHSTQGNLASTSFNQSGKQARELRTGRAAANVQKISAIISVVKMAVHCAAIAQLAITTDVITEAIRPIEIEQLEEVGTEVPGIPKR